MKTIDRRQFLQLLGAGAAASTLGTTISKALAIPANHRTGTIKDVEHIVVLMQENRPFDHHFGTLRGVRGFADPRAVQINLPLASGTGTVPASVFLQPAGPYAAYGVAPDYGNLGGPADGATVIPPFRVNPAAISSGLQSLGLTYLPGTGHGWSDTHYAWNHAQYNQWVPNKGPMAMSYMTRADIPYHYALADAFTVCDAYHCSIMGPTNPNRCYLWAGGIGNADYLNPGNPGNNANYNGADGHGAGPITYNGTSKLGNYLYFETLPEVLQAKGVSWKIYQDIAGATFAPDFGDGTGNSFAGNYTDNSVLYFAQYASSAPGTPLFDNGCTGTDLSGTMPATTSPADWKAWALSLFDQFRADVDNGTLPQVSWIVAPAGYTEHSDYPINYGAWYISQVLEILVSKPEVFSRTALIINYDEADGSFDHVVPGSPPDGVAGGDSTVDYHNEIVTTSTPNGPIGLGTRGPCIVVSPWSKGGFVNSQVFDHTSVIQFIEQRFGVHERNLTPWRRAVCGDLTSVFNFADPDGDHPAQLPSTAAYLPPVSELAGTDGTTFVPTPASVIVGVPAQEAGIRPARALPYELHVHGTANAAAGSFTLDFINKGQAGAVFHVRSANPADAVRMYTVEAGKQLSGTWSTSSGAYDLSVYGPNGLLRHFQGQTSTLAAALDVRAHFSTQDAGSITLSIRNRAQSLARVTVLDAYAGDKFTRVLAEGDVSSGELTLERFNGWYDLVVTVAEDPGFEVRLAGHVETGRVSTSDPAMGGLVKLKA